MPRPERPIDPDQGELHQFAHDLRALRRDAGDPTFLQMARRTGKSRTALSEASGGDHLPTWETVSAYVSACGASPTDWLPRWEQLRDLLKEKRQVPEAGDITRVPEDGDAEAPDTSLQEGKQERELSPASRWLMVAAVAAVTAIAVTVWTLTSDDGQPQPSGPRVLTVQNKIALGVEGMVEDSTPAYLSSRTIARCGQFGCKLSGTSFWSGAVLPVRCYARGTVMHNFDMSADQARRNPDSVESDIWYRLSMPDGQSGWLSEIYVEPAYRGGMGLPICEGLDAQGVEIR